MSRAHTALSAALAGLLFAGVAQADPASQAARRLLDGEPKTAVQAWKEAGVSPADAARAVRGLLPLERGELTDYQDTIRDAAGRETDVRVGMPQGPRDDGRYGVLVMLHGLGGTSKQGFKEVRAFAPPGTIVVAATATQPPDADTAEDLKGLGGFTPVILERLKKWWSYQADAFPMLALDYLKRRYPIDNDRVLLVGISMGGFGAWNLGLRYHDRFSGLMPLAGGMSRKEYMFRKDNYSRQLLDNVAMVPVFFVHGGGDYVVPVAFDRWTQKDLVARNLPHTYHEIPGAGHVINPFEADPKLRDRLVAWMNGLERDPSPRRVEHLALATYHGAAYWVRMDAIAGKSAKVIAEVTQPNVIEVQAGNVERLTLYVDPKLHDVTRPVKVVVNGEQRFSGVVAPSLQAVAETYARTHDARLVYERAVRLDLTKPAATAPTEAEAAPAPTTNGGRDRWFQLR